jgi:6-phospho-beta-glucosidase
LTSGNGVMSDPALAKMLGAVPIGYVHYYFFRNAKFREAKEAPKTRAQQIMEIEKELFVQAADPALETKPFALVKRGGGGYSWITFSVLKSILADSGEKLAVNTLNQGAIHGLPDDVVAEMVCRVDRNGATPLPVGKIPLAYRGLVQAVKTYESLTVEAAITRKRETAVLALAAHPLCGDIDTAAKLIDELAMEHGIPLMS